MSKGKIEIIKYISSGIDQSIVDAVIEINTKLKGDVVFAGSFGLKLNGMLDRHVGDLDVFTSKKYYGNKECLEVCNRSNSAKFIVDGEIVYCVNGETSKGIQVDFMYKKGRLVYEHINFHGTIIKVERPELAIKAKQAYVKTSRHPSKHLADLDYMYTTKGVQKPPIISDDDIDF